MRRNKYAIYNEKEYKIVQIDNHLELISRDEQDLKNGFVRYDRDPNLFIKVVEKSDLETAYDVTPFAVYKGIEFLVIGLNEEKGTVDIYGIDQKVARELGMSTAGRGEFSKTVNLVDVKLIEKVKPIWGFTLDKEN
ncbi:hypothetical protein QUG02_27315 [Bacillus hominis]|uniref:Uncharacterized protein n=1 Tax=Bacillus hominis TaxID=2817478 RepID=A0ABT7RFN0_9BACI|nr:hypothetical protein [Bacillus hominis]MDM5191338.1 hypothetical protein [Bacillus hominis]MDM5436311.1 hypothetical protein [Bacillus hominis]MDM5441733.1 hypothetical protein [Bacillus hominis]